MKRFFAVIIMLCAGLSVWAQNEQAAAEPFDRGIGKANSLFIPKGTVGGGLSVSYANYQLGNGSDDAGYKMLFSLLDNVHGGLQSFGVAPYLSYFIKDNLSLGLRFDYDKSGYNLNVADISLGDLMTLNSKRFAMFAELRATGAYAQSESYKIEGDKKYGTYQDIYKGSLSVVPGLCCFVTNEAALEVSVGVLGFTHQKTVQTTNQVEVSQMVQNNASFKINLFSINMGVSIYIQSKTR